MFIFQRCVIFLFFNFFLRRCVLLILYVGLEKSLCAVVCCCGVFCCLLE